MSKIRIQLFGQFRVQRDEQVVVGLGAHKLQELLCYLLLHRPVSRESLASLLWPNTTTAQSKKKLRQALWRLQSALSLYNEPIDQRLLLVEPDRVQMNKEADLWFDVAIFEEAFELVQSRAGWELNAQPVLALQNAIELYRGPLLEDCYEDWCIYERENSQNRCLTMLDKLVNYCEIHHNYEAGIRYSMRIIDCDRAHERTHRRLMRLHYLNGDRAAALHQYEQCVAALNEELGVKPSKRTLALYKEILAEQLVEPEFTFASTDSEPALDLSTSSLIEVLGLLTQLQEFLVGVQNRVDLSIQQVECAFNSNSHLRLTKPRQDPQGLGEVSFDEEKTPLRHR